MHFTDNILSNHPPQIQARALYWAGWTIAQIAEVTGQNKNTLYSWSRREKWDQATPLTKMNDALEKRYIMLINKSEKTPADLKEISALGREATQMARINNYLETGKESDLNPKIKSRNNEKAKEKREKSKNFITHEMLDKLEEDIEATLYDHQFDWLANVDRRIRFLLKSRQIGATWYFARERVLRAIKTGNNQIFISASKAQAHIFKNYIVAWLQEVCELKLQGDPITLKFLNESGNIISPHLYFLGTNYRTAQGYSGDVIIDEAFWIHGFEDIYKVAAAMATHTKYTKTIFSTPSIITHQAFSLWSGDRFNRKRVKSDIIDVDINHETLRDGALGKDGVYRQIVTLEDAIDKGFDLIDVDEIRQENSIEEFKNLYLCQFLDDSQSSFPFELVRNAMIDSWEKWKHDYNAYARRPFSDGEVWLGYDPNAGIGADDAALVALAPPQKSGGKFRILEKAKLRGKGFEEQAAIIKKWCERYNVTHIAIDNNGVGEAVYQLIVKFFPTAKKIDYSPRGKSLMVHKAQNIMRGNRLEFDAGWKDMLQSFMAIHPDITRSGQHVTYRARRAQGAGHADLAWATMHVLINEPLSADSISRQTGILEFM